MKVLGIKLCYGLEQDYIVGWVLIDHMYTSSLNKSKYRSKSIRAGQSVIVDCFVGIVETLTNEPYLPTVGATIAWYRAWSCEGNWYVYSLIHYYSIP